MEKKTIRYHSGNEDAEDRENIKDSDDGHDEPTVVKKECQEEEEEEEEEVSSLPPTTVFVKTLWRDTLTVPIFLSDSFAKLQRAVWMKIVHREGSIDTERNFNWKTITFLNGRGEALGNSGEENATVESLGIREGATLFLACVENKERWLRYKVCAHDTVRLLSLRFRVGRREIIFYNPGIVLSGEEHRIHRQYVIIPAHRVSSQGLYGLRREGGNGEVDRDSSSSTESCLSDKLTSQMCETWSHESFEATRRTRTEESSRKIFCAMRNVSKPVANIYLESNDYSLRRALEAERTDAAWESEMRQKWRRGKESSEEATFMRVLSKSSSQIRPLLTKHDCQDESAQERFVRRSADAHFRRVEADETCADSVCVLQ